MRPNSLKLFINFEWGIFWKTEILGEIHGGKSGGIPGEICVIIYGRILGDIPADILGKTPNSILEEIPKRICWNNL